MGGMSEADAPGWRLEEKRVKVNGEMRYLWQAVDRTGEILDFYVTKTRDEPAALRFLKKALKGQ